MHFRFTDDQTMISDTADAFLSEVSSSQAVRSAMTTECGYDNEVWSRMVEEMAWTGTHVPEFFGGLSLGYVELTIILEQMGRYLFCSPFYSSVCLAQNALLIAGSESQKSEYLKKIFPNEVYLLHGKTTIEEKEEILNKFLRNEFKILVSTTIIEVGIDFPNANVIIIENANKFGLSQLHQLRGRVGRGNKESSCVLMFKSNLSENAKKRINILKDSNDGFKISEEDMKLRGFGDILGFKQSGIKNFKLADPIHNHNLFILAEKEIKRIENEKEDIGRFKPLIKLYDRADIINDIA